MANTAATLPPAQGASRFDIRSFLTRHGAWIALALLIGILVGALAAAALLISLSRSRVRSAEATRRRLLEDADVHVTIDAELEA